MEVAPPRAGVEGRSAFCGPGKDNPRWLDTPPSAFCCGRGCPREDGRVPG